MRDNSGPHSHTPIAGMANLRILRTFGDSIFAGFKSRSTAGESTAEVTSTQPAQLSRKEQLRRRKEERERKKKQQEEDQYPLTPSLIATPAESAWVMQASPTYSHPRHAKRCTSKMRSIAQLVALVLLLLSILTVVQSDQSCERLKAVLKYTQEEAPRDLSALLPVVVEKVNRVLDGVVDVDIEWTGADLHGHVGEHIVKCKVTRLAVLDEESVESHYSDEVFLDGLGRKVTSQCFHVPFTILDTDECKLSVSHPMRHKCYAPAMCVNTIGSYECVCPKIGTDSSSISHSDSQSGPADEKFWQTLQEQDRTEWDISFQSVGRTSCSGGASTYGCCADKGHTKDGAACRERFRCPVDPCNEEGYYNKRSSSQNNRIDPRLLNDCAPSAECVRTGSPLDIPNFSCICPKGLMGNGHACSKTETPKPMVMYDGVTPTELTVKNNFYCGCTEPAIDACAGFPPCKGKHETCVVTVDNKPKCGCKPGYSMHETYGCVDIHPPRLRLKNDPAGDRTLRLKQGDEYKEHMVDIIDENAEDYFRSLKIAYSEPLPPGCLTKVGELHVNYTIAMPWASPPYVRVMRRVIVEDIDECNADVSKFKTTCPALVPQCDYAAGATCVNKIGGYDCRCPLHSSGDGFLKTASFPPGVKPPTGFEGGTSCVDTSKPVITLLGPNPKVFKTCAFGRLSGICANDAQASGSKDKELQDNQRNLYEEDIKEMIRVSAGAELCATHTNIHPSPADCVKAIDHTYKGDVDLSKRVVVGDLVQKTPLHWAVPYDVTDDAGNKAATVWRDVIVKEIDLSSLESQIRDEVLREQEEVTKKAIEKAVREERMKVDKTGRKSQELKRGVDCPPCPKCSCPSNPSVNEESCRIFCDSSSESCAVDANGTLWTYVFFSFIAPLVTIVFGAIAVMLVIRWMTIAWQARGVQSYDFGSTTAAHVSDGLLRSPVDQRISPLSQAAVGPSTSPFFSADAQPAVASPGWSSLNGGMNGNATPENADRHQTRYSEGMFATPPGVSQQTAFQSWTT